MMAQESSKAPRPKEVSHDETPSGITDHAFEPRGRWWSLCIHCGLAEPAHAETTIQLFRYVSDDMPDE